MKTVLCLFFLFFLIYNANLRSIDEGDAISASLLPFSILEGNLYLDQHSDYFDTITPWMTQNRRGHIISAYPIVTPVIIAPLYIFPYAFQKYNNYSINMLDTRFHLVVEMWEKQIATSIAALAGVFVFLALAQIVSRKAAIASAIMFAIGTNTWATSSQALWQHGLSELLLAILIYLVFLNERYHSNRNFVVMGLLSGLFVFNRPSDSLLLLPILYYVLVNKQYLNYGLPAALAGLPFLAYNLYFYGKIFGVYSDFMWTISANNSINALGLLISPSRGILIYSPIVILAIFGYTESRKMGNKIIKSFLFISIFAIALEILVYGSFYMWHAGGSYGPRFLTGTLPILFILVGIYLNKLNFRKDYDVITFISILLAWSIFVQVVGTFYYPHGHWNPEQAWNWSDMEIFRNFNAGLAWIHPIESFQPLFSSTT